MEQTITCPSCGKKFPLTETLRAEIETALAREFDEKLTEERRRVEQEAARKAEKKLAQDLACLKEQLKDQAIELENARREELALRRHERELQKKAADLEVTVARTLDAERAALVAETQQRLLDEHRLKDAEKERQLADMRKQIEDLKRKAEQGSQQIQGEAGEQELEATLRSAFPWDEITPVAQGVRGADLHQLVIDPRGTRCGAVLWECKNAKNWSESWIAKLKDDQRALRADVAVLVTSCLPKGCGRFAP